MRHAQKRLYTLVERIFEDGVMTEEERRELSAAYSASGLTVSEVREVFRAFVHITWGNALADGVLTDDERQRLAAIVRELHLPGEFVPELAAFAIAS